MTLPQRLNLYRRAIAHFGIAHQQSKVVEEIGELLTAMVHYRNGRISRAALCSEIADVLIVVEQAELMAGIPPGAVRAEMDRKLARLELRLSEV
jgi:NTP pyrophosphatase (non-canonical NTP hydrolase)